MCQACAISEALEMAEQLLVELALAVEWLGLSWNMQAGDEPMPDFRVMLAATVAAKNGNGSTIEEVIAELKKQTS